MWGRDLDVIHYIMLYNENQQQVAKPEGADEGIIRGAYKVQELENPEAPSVRILGSGPMLQYAREAASTLESEHGVSSEVWSVTSYGELRRDGLDSERHNRLNPQDTRAPYASQCFGDDTPTVAVSDYIAAVPEMIHRWVGGRYVVLGTDGFGRSDTRESLRRFFEIDTESIVLAALSALEQEGDMPKGTVKGAASKMGVSLSREDKAE
jgi:pyruvate dehydrogenase E1 component